MARDLGPSAPKGLPDFSVDQAPTADHRALMRVHKMQKLPLSHGISHLQGTAATKGQTALTQQHTRGDEIVHGVVRGELSVWHHWGCKKDCGIFSRTCFGRGEGIFFRWKDSLKQSNGMTARRGGLPSPVCPTSELLHFLPSELRILLLCGSDLLESFCIPGLWNESDVSRRWDPPMHLPQAPSLLCCCLPCTQHGRELPRSSRLTGATPAVPTAPSPCLPCTSNHVSNPAQLSWPPNLCLLAQGHPRHSCCRITLS